MKTLTIVRRFALALFLTFGVAPAWCQTATPAVACSATPAGCAIDAAPPVPNAASYSISELYIYPRAAVVGAFDPTLPIKYWSRPLQPGENPAAFVIFNCYDQNGNYLTGQLGMTRGQAAATNIPPDTAPPPAGSPLAQAVAYTAPQVPFPARPLAASERVQATPFGLMVINTAFVAPAVPQTAQQSSDSATLQQILRTVLAIAQKDGVQ